VRGAAPVDGWRSSVSAAIRLAAQMVIEKVL
jgi:hypothetical protein